MINLKINDKIIIRDYYFKNSNINLENWKAEVIRLDLINKIAYVNLDKQNLISIDKEKILEMDKMGFRTMNVEIPFEKLIKIEEKSKDNFIENLDEIYPKRIYAKSNLFSSMTIASLSLFPFVFCLIGIILNSIHYYKFISNPILNNILDEKSFLVKSFMLIIIFILTGLILFKGIKDFIVILKLNTYGNVKNSKIKNIYSAKRKNKIKNYIVFESLNGIEIHQKIHWSKVDGLWINKEIKVKYFDEDPSIALAIDF